MQSAETLRRAVERSMRSLPKMQQDGENAPNGAQALREFLGDAQADLASLAALRKTADDLLHEGIEAEAFLHLCEVALEAVELTMKRTSFLENANFVNPRPDPESGTYFDLQVKKASEQAHVLCCYFRRLAEWLRTPPPPLTQPHLDKLESSPPVTRAPQDLPTGV